MELNPREDDEGSMLRPEEYTLPGIEALQLPAHRPGYNAETVKRARAGNLAASTEVFSEFIATVNGSTEQTWLGAVPWSCARFIADRLRAVLNGDPLDAAANLGIRSGRADRQSSKPKCSRLAVAAFYFLLIRAGVAPKAAKSLMNERAGLTDVMIEEAVKEYPGFQYQDRFTVEILVELAAAYRARIAEIIASGKLRLS
jgi:hypothetical protein